MSDFLSFTIFGLVLAAIYAVAASGLVVTYTTTGIFNFAHGAIGMFGAYVFWQLHVAWGLNVWLAAAIVLIVVAPAMGVFIDRVIMRGLSDVPEVTKVVVSIGLLFGLLALAPIVWSSRRSYVPISFFGNSQVDVLGMGVTYHQFVAIGAAIAVAIALRIILYGTRSGVAMRAVVDDRSLARLNGARPERTSSMSWALGCSLAALAGILIQERVGFDVLALTFLVVNAYAAAVVGRLTNLPLTFLGAVILGLTQAYAQGYLPKNPDWVPEGFDLTTPVRLAVPVILLFVTLLVLPNAPLRAQGLTRSRESVARPRWRLSFAGFGVLILVAGVVSFFLSEADLIGWGKGLAYALIMLSMVPLTGYGGQISLAQVSLAGIAAFSMARFGADGSVVGLVIALGITALVGAVVALPALRLRGIYLALGTLAFSYLIEKVVLVQTGFVGAGTKAVDRLRLGPLAFESNQSYFILLAVVFSLAGCAVVAVRLGPFGRRLQAMKDSPAACATLGINLTVTKLQVFMLSATIAGLGGVMLAGLQKRAQVDDFGALANLPILLMAVGGGIAMVSGSFFGGMLYAAFGLIAKKFPALDIVGVDGKVVVNDILLLAPALIGISLGRNPNGAAAEMSRGLRDVRDRWRHRDQDTELSARLQHMETLGIDRPFTQDDLVAIDARLGLDEASAAVYSAGAAASWEASVGADEKVGSGDSA